MKSYWFGHRINILGRMHSKRLLEKFIGTGLTSSQWPIIAHLLYYKESTQTAICKELAIEAPTISKTLYNMEMMGWITRMVDATDKREKKVLLTDKAKKMVPYWLHSMDELQKQLLKGISEDEIEIFDRVLDKLILALNKRTGSESPETFSSH
jgi:MarR family transcriptional regulator, transcriptional regulator for hemolysin